jgi:hypothetical protein
VRRAATTVPATPSTSASSNGFVVRVAAVANPIAQIHHAIGWTMRGSRSAATELTLFPRVCSCRSMSSGPRERKRAAAESGDDHDGQDDAKRRSRAVVRSDRCGAVDDRHFELVVVDRAQLRARMTSTISVRLGFDLDVEVDVAVARGSVVVGRASGRRVPEGTKGGGPCGVWWAAPRRVVDVVRWTRLDEMRLRGWNERFDGAGLGVKVEPPTLL